MLQNMNPITLLILYLVLPAPVEALGSERKIWAYETPKGIRRFEQVDGKKWQLRFPNDATIEIEELSRNDKFVELRNPTNDNVMRLFADRIMNRGKNKTEFRKMADGGWFIPEPAPTGVFGPTDYRIRVVYFVPNDRQPTANYETKINLILRLNAEIMTRELRVKGHKTEGPQFETTDDDQIKVHQVTGEQAAQFYNKLPKKTPEHAQSIFQEIDRRLGAAETHNVFIFSETYDEGRAEQLWPGHTAVAAARPPSAGIAVFSAWILRDEFCPLTDRALRAGFFDERPYAGRKAIGHRGPNSPRADFLEDGIGGALHELAHTFGLTHQRNPKNNVMAQGFRSLRWNVGLKRNPREQAVFSPENAALLMTSRFLNPDVDRTDNTQPKLKLQLTVKGQGLAATIEASDDKVLRYAAIVEVTEKAGRQLLQARPLSKPNESITFELKRDQVTSDNPELQAFVVDGGGNMNRVTKRLSN
ncbi:MAG: hypothetical protein ACKVII_21255 [Planctomycetales bacterium]|jgi:hypothetical protein